MLNETPFETVGLLTVEDAAAFLKVSPKTVYRMIADGELRSRKCAGHHRFRREWLNQFIDGEPVDSKPPQRLNLNAKRLIQQFDL